MIILIPILIQWVNLAFDCANLVFDLFDFLFVGNAAGVILAPTIGIVTGLISEGIILADEIHALGFLRHINDTPNFGPAPTFDN
jgi:hypothetical protein